LIRVRCDLNEHSIEFHGWTKDSICVGGSADGGLKRIIKEAIQNTLKEKGYVIQVKDSDCPEGFNGNNKDNIVNRLGIAGIQIEQCMEARKQSILILLRQLLMPSVLGSTRKCIGL